MAGRTVIKKVPAGWERDEFVAWLQRGRGAGTLVIDLSDAPGGEPAHIIVKRASGFVAGWNFPDIATAETFARECNDALPSDRAHVAAWDDSVWDAVLETAVQHAADDHLSGRPHSSEFCPYEGK
jgi:hypothetical protein